MLPFLQRGFGMHWLALVMQAFAVSVIDFSSTKPPFLLHWAVNPGLCLGAREIIGTNNRDDQTGVHLIDCPASGTDQRGSLFQFDEADGHMHWVANTGFCLHAPLDSFPDQGKGLVFQECQNDNKNQQFSIDSASGRIRMQASPQKCLDAKSGVNSKSGKLGVPVLLGDCAVGTPTQLFVTNNPGDEEGGSLDANLLASAGWGIQKSNSADDPVETGILLQKEDVVPTKAPKASALDEEGADGMSKGNPEVDDYVNDFKDANSLEQELEGAGGTKAGFNENYIMSKELADAGIKLGKDDDMKEVDSELSRIFDLSKPHEEDPKLEEGYSLDEDSSEGSLLQDYWVGDSNETDNDGLADSDRPGRRKRARRVTATKRNRGGRDTSKARARRAGRRGRSRRKSKSTSGGGSSSSSGGGSSSSSGRGSSSSSSRRGGSRSSRTRRRRRRRRRPRRRGRSSGARQSSGGGVPGPPGPPGPRGPRGKRGPRGPPGRSSRGRRRRGRPTHDKYGVPYAGWRYGMKKIPYKRGSSRRRRRGDRGGRSRRRPRRSRGALQEGEQAAKTLMRKKGLATSALQMDEDEKEEEDEGDDEMEDSTLGDDAVPVEAPKRLLTGAMVQEYQLPSGAEVPATSNQTRASQTQATFAEQLSSTYGSQSAKTKARATFPTTGEIAAAAAAVGERAAAVGSDAPMGLPMDWNQFPRSNAPPIRPTSLADTSYAVESSGSGRPTLMRRNPDAEVEP